MCHAPKRHGNHTTILQSDWSKDNRKNHEGPEGSKRTNQMRRNITCKFTWRRIRCSTWDELLWQLESQHKNNDSFHMGMQKFWFTNENTLLIVILLSAPKFDRVNKHIEDTSRIIIVWTEWIFHKCIEMNWTVVVRTLNTVQWRRPAR